MAELTLDEIRAMREMQEKVNRERKPAAKATASPQRIACGHCGQS